MAVTLKLSEKGKKIVEQRRKEKGFNKDDRKLSQNASIHLEPENEESWNSLWKNGQDIYADNTSLATWRRFFDGDAINEKAFKAFCKVLDLSWEELIERDINFPDVNSSFKAFQTNQSKDNSTVGILDQFQALIEEKTKDFVGRKYVFEEIQNFLDTQNQGYFLIEADPGVGKSAISAKYIQNRLDEGKNCVFHFNEQRLGKDTIELFLNNIHHQINTIFKLNYPEPSADNFQSSTYLENLLKTVSKELDTREDKQLVILVDALDEVNIDNHPKNKNILFLPDNCPKNIYFVMTKRKRHDVLLPHSLEKILDLMSDKYIQGSLEDVQEYIGKAVSTQEVQKWVGDRSKTEQDLVDTLTKKSDRNFMYLRCVLDDIKKNVFESFDSLPQGLKGYYEWHWQRMKIKLADEWYKYQLKVIEQLTIARRPLSFSLIMERAGIPSSEDWRVKSILQEWSQFILFVKENLVKLYFIYHKSFEDFLYEKAEITTERMDLRKSYEMSADANEKILFEEFGIEIFEEE